MTNYRINININEIIEDNGNLGQFFFTEDWREATELEINSFLLNQAKEKKLAELKANRIAYKKATMINSDYSYWDCDTENNVYNFNNVMNCICGWTEEERTLFIEITEFISDKYDTIKASIKQSTLEPINLISTNF